MFQQHVPFVLNKTGILEQKIFSQPQPSDFCAYT